MPFLAGIGPLGLPELIIILVVIVIIFGVGKLPQIGGAIGQGIREFRHASKDEEEARERAEMEQAQLASQQPVVPQPPQQYQQPPPQPVYQQPVYQQPPAQQPPAQPASKDGSPPPVF